MADEQTSPEVVGAKDIDDSDTQPAALGGPKRQAASAADYRVIVYFDAERGLFVARAPEVDHCEVEAPTRSEAMARLEEQLEAQLDNIRNAGHEPPVAAADVGAFSGELTLRVPKGLHRDLYWLARNEGTTLEQLATEFLGRGADARLTSRPRRGDSEAAPRQARGRPGHDRERGSGDPRYHAVMDDRAHFIEYVRQLESGDRRGGGGGRGRGGRHR